MIENQLTFEGLFSKVLYCKPVIDKLEDKVEYGFHTRKTALTSEFPTKTPSGLFEKDFIPNDLAYVFEEIRKFNEGE